MSSAAAEVSLFKTKLNSSRCNSKALSPPLLLCRAQELLGGPVGSPSDQLRGTCRRAAKRRSLRGPQIKSIPGESRSGLCDESRHLTGGVKAKRSGGGREGGREAA